MAAAHALHRDTRDLVATYIALNPDIRAALLQAGVPAERIEVKPNTVVDPGPPTAPGAALVFVGRLSEEKGVLLLLDAWEAHEDGSRGELVLVGDGPLRAEVSARAARRTDVRMTGLLDADAVSAEMAAGRAVVVPSTWTEAFPMVVLEAMARGRPVVSSRLGGLPDIVTPDVGWVVEPSARPLSEALAEVVASPEAAAAKGSAARRRFETTYHPDVVTRRLVAIYEGARLPA
jgi:glycosyltransferase involved in cell wall biosynthesis